MFHGPDSLKEQHNNCFSSFLPDSETVAREEKTRSYQWQSQSSEGPHSASCWKRQRALLQTGESWYSGNDSPLPPRSSCLSCQRWASPLEPWYACLKKCFTSHILLVDFPVSNQTFSPLPPDSADSYREGYKACLQRVSTLLPKTSLDQDACQRVNEFVQQSMSATVTPTCLNCCAQSSRSLPQIQQRLLSLKSSFSSRLEPQSRSGSSSAGAPSRAQPGPLPVSAAMWRPW